MEAIQGIPFWHSNPLNSLICLFSFLTTVRLSDETSTCLSFELPELISYDISI